MTKMFLIRVKSEINNKSNFSRIHHYLNSFSEHFGDIPILADPRKRKIRKVLDIGTEEQIIIEHYKSRGIRFYLLKDTNMGQVLFLIFNEIFDSMVEIIIPEDFKINPKIKEWFLSQKQLKTKSGKKKNLVLTEEKKKEIRLIKR